MSLQKLVINAVLLDCHPKRVVTWTRPWSSKDDLRALREQHEHEWFLRREGDQLIGVSRVQSPTPLFGKETVRDLDLDPGLLRALVRDARQRLFPKDPIHWRPFTILSTQAAEDRMKRAAERTRIHHPLLSGFRVVPKMAIDAQVVTVGGRPRVALVVDFADRWEINIALEALQEADVDLSGLCVVRRRPEQGERHLVGRIGALHGGMVQISRNFQHRGSSCSFTACALQR
jgi:hypothetical protein